MSRRLPSLPLALCPIYRCSRRHLLGVMVAIFWAALLTVVLTTDQPLEQWWDRVGDDVALLDAVAVFLTLAVRADLIALGLLLLTMLDRRLRWHFMGQGATLMLGQAALCSGFKQFFGRLRPDAAAEATLFFGPTTADMSFSFPSGHATAAWTLAGLLSMYYPRCKWLFMIAAAAVCLARVQLDRHFPSDILAGAVLGWYLSTATIRWQRSRTRLARNKGEATGSAAA